MLDDAALFVYISPVYCILYYLGKTAHNAFDQETTMDVVRFIKRYAEKYGLPQPAAPRARPETPPIYLPCGTTKIQVHKTYMESAITDQRKFVRLQTFKDIWTRTCPDVKIMTRREDCCAKCELMRDTVIKAVSEKEKEDALNSFKKHMDEAYRSRDYYASCIQKAKAGEIKHLIFDFAEQLSIPSTTRQVGPMYFKVGRRMQLFGICNTALPHQANYLFDEHQTIGPDGKKSHGPNCVISMLHHYLGGWSKDIPHLVLHADNCCAQNKNKSVVAYLALRMLKGCHTSLKYDFMLAGHTRSLVDGCFGLVKMKYRRQDNYTVTDLVNAVNKSTVDTNSAVLYPAWSWQNWDEYLAQFFKPVPGITKLHSLDFHRDGTCTSNDGQNIRLLKAEPTGEPSIIPAAGLSEERMSYLRDKVGPLMPTEHRESIYSQY